MRLFHIIKLSFELAAAEKKLSQQIRQEKILKERLLATLFEETLFEEVTSSAKKRSRQDLA